jgi:hypothetical protein
MPAKVGWRKKDWDEKSTNIFRADSRRGREEDCGRRICREECDQSSRDPSNPGQENQVANGTCAVGPEKWSLNMKDASKPEIESELRYPEWQRPLQEALMESDKAKLKARVESAEAIIFGRLQAISHDSNHHAERDAVEHALSLLRTIKRDSLQFPDWKVK